MLHNFVVVNSLVVPVILGVDFLQTHGVLLDFSTTPVKFGTTNVPDVSSNQEALYSSNLQGRTDRKDKMMSYCSPARCYRCSG